MLMPKKTKYRKRMKGRNDARAAKGGYDLNFGTIGLKCMENGLITSRQIEAARIAINRKIRRGGKVFIRIFPDRPITRKPLEVRMGKGKGSVEYWVAPVQAGRILFEIAGVDDELARAALRLASMKLPVKAKIVTEIEVGII